MNKIDLIIDALEEAVNKVESAYVAIHIDEALAAARELKALEPVAWMGSAGLGYDKNKYLSIPLYALDEVTK